MRAPLIISAALHALLACFVVTLRVVDPPIDESVGLMLVSAHTARDRRVVRVRRPTMLRSRKDGGPVSLAVSRSLPVRRATAPPRAAAPIHVPREHAPVAEFQASPTPTASPTGPSDIAGDSRDDGYRADGAAAARSRPTAKHPRRGRSGLSMSMDSGSPTSPSAAITTPTLELKTPLDLIAEHVIRSETGDKPVDLVFLLDISQSMQDNIYAVAKHLEGMAARFEEHEIDFRLGIVTFHHSTWNTIRKNNVNVTKLTDDVDKIRKKLRQVKCSGGEKALNAIMEALHRVRFREGASRRFVFVTDEYVDGDYPEREVSGALYRARIHVDVIGVDEPFQRSLPAQTGGMWIPIASLTG